MTTAPLPRPPSALERLERLAEARDHCGCAHTFALHHPDGPCAVELPPFPEEELPAWRCPCRKFTAAAALPAMWRWHSPSQTWAATGRHEVAS